MTTKVLETFREQTGANIGLFLQNFVLFCNNYYHYIVSYYQGEDVNEIGDVFARLDSLIDSARQIEPLFTLKSNVLNGLEMWELLDVFTDCETKLWTIDNSSKWLRSAIIGRYGSITVVKRYLRTGETFEKVSQELGSSNPQNDWFDMVRNNFIEEEQYAPDQGVMFKINIRTSGNHNIDNIVDNLQGDNILGKDIDKNLKFENGDLAVVEFDNAIAQALDTMLNCVRGAIPEFPTYGLPTDCYGVSRSALQYPSIFKSIVNMVQRDGRWSSVELLDLSMKDDYLMMKIRATTVANNQIVTNVEI